LVLYQIVGIFLYGFVGLFQDLDTINWCIWVEDLDSMIINIIITGIVILRAEIATYLGF
jgi:hypothetical protein